MAIQTFRSSTMMKMCFSEDVLVIFMLLYLYFSYFVLVQKRTKFALLNVDIVIQRTRAVLDELLLHAFCQAVSQNLAIVQQ